eukprot:2871668-Amphidinium_carterae.1
MQPAIWAEYEEPFGLTDELIQLVDLVSEYSQLTTKQSGQLAPQKFAQFSDCPTLPMLALALESGPQEILGKDLQTFYCCIVTQGHPQSSPRIMKNVLPSWR